jgi:RHS repeat-associated protein
MVSHESNAAIHHFAGYTGGHIDVDTSFVNNDHRWYDPATGRWMSQDPEGFAAGDADLSRYVGNLVTGMVDRTGLTWVTPAHEELLAQMAGEAAKLQLAKQTAYQMMLWAAQAAAGKNPPTEKVNWAASTDPLAQQQFQKLIAAGLKPMTIQKIAKYQMSWAVGAIKASAKADKMWFWESEARRDAKAQEMALRLATESAANVKRVKQTQEQMKQQMKP